MSSFLTNFKYAFDKSHLTQAELSRLTHIPRSNIHDYLAGKYIPKEGRVIELAKVLGVNPGWLSGSELNSKYNIKNMDNLYLDNQIITDSEMKQIINFLRLLRVMNTNKK